MSTALPEQSYERLQIDTNRSNVLPATLLVGLSVNAVTLAFATASVPVLVYCVWAKAIPIQSERQTTDFILDRSCHSTPENKNTMNITSGSKSKRISFHHIPTGPQIPMSESVVD
jgi:hypothetical protein